MPSKTQRAKKLFENKQFAQAKQLLLEVVASGHPHSLFDKLGDISIELNQHKAALKYYHKSMTKHPKNPFIYIKIGDLHHQHLNNNDIAIQMYEKCLQLSPTNELCWFKYGKLSFELSNYSKAEHCYLNCLTPRACVKYHYARLLLVRSQQNPQNQQKALQLLLTATKLKPTVFRYHYQYAKCLKSMQMFKKANKSFQTALRLSEHEDMNMLYQYSLFLSQCMNNNKTALKYLQMAIDLDKNSKHSYLKQAYDDICELLAYDNSLYHPHIKLIIYSFQQTITYHNISHELNDLNAIKLLKKNVLVNEIFGGDDRIDRLHLHFQQLLNSKNNIKLAILSVHINENVMIEALGRVGLVKYFNKQNVMQCKNDILNAVFYLTDSCTEINNLCTQVLYIDDKEQNINLVCNDCISYFVYSDDNKILNALSMAHLKEIEQIVGVYSLDEYDMNGIHLNTLSKNVTIKDIDGNIYRNIKKEIGAMRNDYEVMELPVIQWINKNWTDQPYKQHFLYFAKIFKIVRKLAPKGRDWTVANILPLILNMVPTDSEMQRRYAKCLAFLGHCKNAEFYYKNAIQHSRHYLHRMEYAYFLLKQERYLDSEIYFKQCINEMENNNFTGKKSQIYTGYTRCLEKLNRDINEIEKYYKLAIQSADSQYVDVSLLHYYFGQYLYTQNKYEKSRIEFENALKYKPDSINNHYGISKIFYKMNMFDQYEYHLKQVLALDPNHDNAQNDLNTFLEQGNNNQNSNESAANNGFVVDNGNINGNTNPFKEQFDRFWFEEINILTGSFNRYFDQFEKNKMNDIRFILFEDDLQNKLKYKIGITSINDLNVLMEKINNIQNEQKLFLMNLAHHKIKEFNPIFSYNAIYTREAIINSVKKESDIVELIRCYNNGVRNKTNRFDVNDTYLLKRLWRFAQMQSNAI